ncbi:50S ribosomal protein L35 [Candidatus Falkowbacteria bacterium]|nr:50S ribosomal protein L35 [Candidatus Falkowbacteria bacterium]
MPKIKTHKATAKRFKVTKNEKILKRKAGQDHFNSRESGKVKRNKRRDINISHTEKRAIKQLMPYNYAKS